MVRPKSSLQRASTNRGSQPAAHPLSRASARAANKAKATSNRNLGSKEDVNINTTSSGPTTHTQESKLATSLNQGDTQSPPRPKSPPKTSRIHTTPTAAEATIQHQQDSTTETLLSPRTASSQTVDNEGFQLVQRSPSNRRHSRTTNSSTNSSNNPNSEDLHPLTPTNKATSAKRPHSSPRTTGTELQKLKPHLKGSSPKRSTNSSNKSKSNQPPSTPAWRNSKPAFRATSVPPLATPEPLPETP